MTAAGEVASLRGEVDQLRAAVNDHLQGRDETTRQMFFIIGACTSFGVVALGLACWALVRGGLVDDVARLLRSMPSGPLPGLDEIG
jgi:hypothetical protein